MSHAASRGLLAVAAVLVVAWLALMERDARLAAAGKAALQGAPTPAKLRDAAADLRAARLLNPDKDPATDLALVLRAQGHTKAAIAQMDSVLRDEPDNLVAWGLLYVLARGEDPAARARAREAATRLNPYGFR